MITALFSMWFVSVISIVNCSSSKKPAKKPTTKKSKRPSSSAPKKETQENPNVEKKEETPDELKFEYKPKEPVDKRDEFDDNEENPLAKIPTKNRLPKKAVEPAPTAASTAISV